MLNAEARPAFLFACVVTLVLVLFASACVREVAERFHAVPRARPGRLRARRAILALGAVGAACIAWGFVEPYWPEVSRARVESARLPPGALVRIVHVSDLHSDARPRLEPRLPALVAAQRPDIIVFTGDAINGPQGLSIFREAMRSLASIAPTFAVKGNWDVWYWPELERFQGTGVRELDGAVSTTVRGARVWMVGVPFEAETRISGALASVPTGEPLVFLYHSPDAITEVAGHADLMCAGHTHGGQVRLPLYGALITFSRFGKRFEAGRYDVDGTTLFVNRGIGMEGGVAPRVRFLCRPEVTLLELAGPAR